MLVLRAMVWAFEVRFNSEVAKVGVSDMLDGQTPHSLYTDQKISEISRFKSQI